MTSVAWRWRWSGVNAELLVSQDVANVLDSHRQQPSGVECGGQLFVNPATPDGLLLAFATPPHPSDRAGLTWLELDVHRCQLETKQANAQGLRLVGYWHTHPQTVPEISLTDIRSFSAFAARYRQDLPNPLAVIVGQSTHPEGIKAWSFRDGMYVEATWTK